MMLAVQRKHKKYIIILHMMFIPSGSDEESDEDSEDESDWSESEDESDSEGGGLDLDVCPSGCDQNLYDNTCALREKRSVVLVVLFSLSS